MVNNIFKLKQNQPSTTGNSEVSTSTINQINYLQKIIGNKEVSNLIQMGIIHSDRPLSPDMSLIANQKKKEEYEAEQIEKDKKELMEEIEAKVREKKEEADTLYLDGSGEALFVNVKTHVVFAEIPGEPPLLFYHYLDLVDVSFSYQNIEKQDKQRDIKRGQIIPYTFSYKYQPDEETFKKIREEEPEEPEKETESDKKKKKSMNKSDKKEEVSTTIIKETDSTDKNG